jgi:hypothetical protein
MVYLLVHAVQAVESEMGVKKEIYTSGTKGLLPF